MSKSHISHLTNSPAFRSGANASPRPPVGIGRRQRRAAETRLRIFRCALELIAERGLADVTVEDITEAADVGKGTFFNYFASKDHVLGVLAEVQVGKVKEAASKAAQGKQPIHSVLRQLVRGLAEEPGRNPCLARAMISSFLASASVREIVKRNMREGLKTIAGVVAAGQQRGEIDPRLDTEKVAMQLLQAMMGTVLLWSLHEKPGLAAWMENTLQHTWRSIAAPGRKRAS
jgi:AcrR family transcriptional regulator